MSQDNPFLAAAFLQRYIADQRESAPKSLLFYQQLFPGHEELIAREYAGLPPQRIPECAGFLIPHHHLGSSGIECVRVPPP